MRDSNSPVQKLSEESEDSVHLLKHAEYNNEEDLHWSSQPRSRTQTAIRMIRNPLVIANILLFLLSTRGFWFWWKHDRQVNAVLKESSLYCK